MRRQQRTTTFFGWTVGGSTSVRFLRVCRFVLMFTMVLSFPPSPLIYPPILFCSLGVLLANLLATVLCIMSNFS